MAVQTPDGEGHIRRASTKMPVAGVVLSDIHLYLQDQCFLLGQNIGQATPTNTIFHYLTDFFPDQSIQKNISFNFEKGSTVQDAANNVQGDLSDVSPATNTPGIALCRWQFRRPTEKVAFDARPLRCKWLVSLRQIATHSSWMQPIMFRVN